MEDYVIETIRNSVLNREADEKILKWAVKAVRDYLYVDGEEIPDWMNALGKEEHMEEEDIVTLIRNSVLNRDTNGMILKWAAMAVCDYLYWNEEKAPDWMVALANGNVLRIDDVIETVRDLIVAEENGDEQLKLWE